MCSAFLWLTLLVLTIVAFFAILFTGRYPRGIFDFNLGVLRWTWRVAFYSYGVLGTDRYPPFTLEDVPEYPARLEVVYPERLSRGLVLVKWWLLAIPQYIVTGIFLGGGSYAAAQVDNWFWGIGFETGLIGVLVLFAGVVLLFTSRYPSGLFDLVVALTGGSRAWPRMCCSWATSTRRSDSIREVSRVWGSRSQPWRSRRRLCPSRPSQAHRRSRLPAELGPGAGSRSWSSGRSRA